MTSLPDKSSFPKRGSPEWWDLQLEREIAIHKQVLEELRAIRALLVEVRP